MNKLKKGFIGVGLAAYGWALYVSYWARPNIVWHKIQKLEWEAYVNPSSGAEKEIEAWKKWKRMTFLEQMLEGPPRRDKID